VRGCAAGALLAARAGRTARHGGIRFEPHGFREATRRRKSQRAACVSQPRRLIPKKRRISRRRAAVKAGEVLEYTANVSKLNSVRL